MRYTRMMHRHPVLRIAIALSTAACSGILTAELLDGPFPAVFPQLQINSGGDVIKVDPTECYNKDDFTPCKVEDNCKQHYCYERICVEGESKCDDGDPITIDSCDYSWPYPYQCKHVDDSGKCRTNEDCQKLSQPVPGGSDECAPFGFCDQQTHTCKKQQRDGEPCSPESNESVNMQEWPDSCFTEWTCQYGRCHGEGMTDACRCRSDELTGPDCRCKNGKKPPFCTECPEGLSGENCEQCKNGDLNPPACNDCMGDPDPGDNDGDGVCNSKDPCPLDAHAGLDAWGRCPSAGQPLVELPHGDGELLPPPEGDDADDPFAIPDSWIPEVRSDPYPTDPFSPDIETIGEVPTPVSEGTAVEIPVEPSFPAAPPELPVGTPASDALSGGGGNDAVGTGAAGEPFVAFPAIPALPFPLSEPPVPLGAPAVPAPPETVMTPPPAPEQPMPTVEFRQAEFSRPSAPPFWGVPVPQEAPAPLRPSAPEEPLGAEPTPPPAAAPVRLFEPAPMQVPLRRSFVDSAPPAAPAAPVCNCADGQVCVSPFPGVTDCVAPAAVTHGAVDAGYGEAMRTNPEAMHKRGEAPNPYLPERCTVVKTLVFPYVNVVCAEV